MWKQLNVTYGDQMDLEEALNPEVQRTVNNLIKAMAKKYGYEEKLNNISKFSINRSPIFSAVNPASLDITHSLPANPLFVLSSPNNEISYPKV